jgi:hypothetical protein
MVRNDMSPVAQQRVWVEHLHKLSTQERRAAAAGTSSGTFSVNPMKLKGKTMTEPKINQRETRFLNREHAALAAMQRQLERSDPSSAAAMQLQQSLPAIGRPAASASVKREAAGVDPAEKPSTASRLPALPGASPHGASASKRATAAIDAASLHEAMATANRGPTAKYSFPQTESQEVGWMSQPLVRPERQFTHGLKKCDVTKMNAFVRAK